MQRRQDEASDAVWVLVEPGVVIRYGPSGPDTVTVIGRVDSSRLRRIRTSGWDTIDPRNTDLPTWDTEPTRDEIEVEDMWAYTTEATAATSIAEEMAGIDEWITADEFYKALAETIRAIGPIDGSLNRAISRALDVTPNTAAQYIYRCRQRGYLPPSRKGQS